MSIHLHGWTFALLIGMGMGFSSAYAQKQAEPLAISKIRQTSLQLYTEPDLNASSKTIDIPSGDLGSDWRVLDTHKQFYKIQAGSHGQGWARRSFITVVRGSGVASTCIATLSAPTEPMASTAGAGRRGC